MSSSGPVAIVSREPRTVLIAGASGFLGSELRRNLEERGDTVVTLGRGSANDAIWGDTAAIDALVERADVVINLAGKSVNCRYTDANRDEILRSRTRTTAELRESIARASAPPRVWLNASTATIYRHAMDHGQSEHDGEIGGGFSVNVAESWEKELFRGELPATRRVAMRIPIVLGDGPATELLFRVARLGAGGPQHDGRWFPHRRYRGIGAHPTNAPRSWSPTRGAQKFSWVHVDDLLAIVLFLIESDLEGPVNLAAPGVSDNRGLMRALRRAVGMPIGLPSARFMLEPAMWALRTESEMLLKSRWILSEKLTEAGFVFEHPELEPALADVWKTRTERRSS